MKLWPSWCPNKTLWNNNQSQIETKTASPPSASCPQIHLDLQHLERCCHNFKEIWRKTSKLREIRILSKLRRERLLNWSIKDVSEPLELCFSTIPMMLLMSIKGRTIKSMVWGGGGWGGWVVGEQTKRVSLDAEPELANWIPLNNHYRQKRPPHLILNLLSSLKLKLQSASQLNQYHQSSFSFKFIFRL